MGSKGRSWRAYLSTQATDGKLAINARDRIGIGSWHSAKGVLIATDLDDLHYSNANVNYHMVLNEKGETVNSANKAHRIYPYLLRDIEINRSNQVRCTDITYLPMAKGFAYLVTIMDWYSRKVLSWRVSNVMDSDFCIEALEEAIHRYGTPEIFNTDQGAQFTANAFTDVLKQNNIRILMDGKGRWIDNCFH